MDIIFTYKIELQRKMYTTKHFGVINRYKTNDKRVHFSVDKEKRLK